MLIAVTRGRGKTWVASINTRINNADHHPRAAITRLRLRRRPERLCADKRRAGIGLHGVGKFNLDAGNTGLFSQRHGGL